MKKFFLIAVVLMLTTPAWAVTPTVTITAGPNVAGDANEILITYSVSPVPASCEDGNRPRAFGLNISLTDGNIVEVDDYFDKGECDDVNKGYGIFPGNIAIDAGVVTSYSNPVAPAEDPGAENTGLDTNTVVLEMGSLYVDTNCPPATGLLCMLRVSLDTCLDITGDAARTGTGGGSGVVLENLGEVTVVFVDSYCPSGVSQFVPNVIGQIQADACDMIMEANCVVGDITWECNETYGYDYVIGQSPAGGAEVPHGTEVDLVKSLGPCDWGDAPDPTYPTLAASNGAVHRATGVILGAVRDTELDGQPNASATGDDIAGAADEEGVVIGPFNLVAIPVVVTVTAPCLLNAWVDFNDNGDWDDAGEQVFTDTPLVAGPNPLIINVAAGAVKNDWLISRWRVNDAGGLDYTGLADDGEVEDYNTLQVRCHVPDVVNEPNLAAQAEIIANGFTIGNITEASHPTIPDDNVISTDPPYCEYPGCDTAVDIVISTGPGAGWPYPDCWDWLGQCEGDAHGDDGDVDTDDFILFKAAFGAVKDVDVNYDPCCDLDRDGDIDTDDFIVFKANFGDTGLGGCPQGDLNEVYKP